MLTSPFGTFFVCMLGFMASGVLLLTGISRNRYSDDLFDTLQQQIEDLKEELYSLSNQAPSLTVNESKDNALGRRLQLNAADSFTYVVDFGAVGDAKTDDTLAVQAAINSAATSASGGTVVFGAGTYLTTAPLILPGGVTLQGQGYGSSPLAIKFDSGASTVAYCGTDYAIKIQGHASSVQDIAVYDWQYNSPDPTKVKNYCATLRAAGGVLVDATAKGIESVRMSNVLLYFFTGGTALTIKGTNGGGIAYSSFSDLRIRHAKRGIHLSADATSFVNSNQFFGGAISGTIEDIAVLAEGPGACNDNKFYGMVIEPPVTSITHVHVKGAKTNIRMHDVRLEGTGMVAFKRPLVLIEDDSYGNVMNGVLGHTHVQGDFLRNPDIDFVGAKTVGIDPAPLNMFSNAAFRGFDGSSLPHWNLPGTNRVITKLNEELFSNHQVLRVDHLGTGGAFQLSPVLLATSPAHSSCTFGIYARTNTSGAIVATMRYESGSMISSTEHTGSGLWEFISMSALMSKTLGARPIFFITGDVDITAPTFVYGSTPATPGASFMSASGAIMSGTLTMGMTTVYPPAAGQNQYYWTLPSKEGNVFQMNMNATTNRSIQRLNPELNGRFPKGTIVTLLFLETGTTVVNSAYLKLLGNANFTVLKANSSITLVSNGDSTWTEVSRNV
jgi:hypothetical protein